MRPLHCGLALAVMLLVATSVVSGQMLSRAGAGGAVAGLGDGWQPQVATSGELVSPALGPVRLSALGSFARATGRDARVASELIGGMRLSSLVGAGGVWLGSDVVRRRSLADVVEQPRLTAGGWRRFGDVVITLSTTRRSTRLLETIYSEQRIAQLLIGDTLGGIDTLRLPDLVVHDSMRRPASRRWAETEAGISWERRRWSASLGVGGRLASRGVPHGMWVSADLGVGLVPPLSLVVGGSVASGARYFPASEHRFVSVGFRLAPRFFRSLTLPAPSIVTATAFSLTSVGGGAYRITLRAPRAHRIDLSGDFTGWRPVALARDGDDVWSVTLPLTTGTHRVNVRIDGGPWIAPPGVMTTSDDFAGEVGLVVVDERSGAAK